MTATATIPQELLDLFQEPALGHVSYHNDKGQIVTWPLWVDFDGEHVVTSSRMGSAKGKSFRERPEVAVSVVSAKNAWHWVSISGRVTDIVPDEGLEFINRMSQKYMGQAYRDPGPREKFLITIERVSSSKGS